MSEKYRPFSERHGYTQPKLPQLEEMDDDLRSGLWNAFYVSFPESFTEADALQGQRALPEIYKKVFVDYLKQNVDEYCGQDAYFLASFSGHPMKQEMINTINFVKNFFFRGEWYGVYDLMEFVMKNSNDKSYRNQCNSVLGRENSAYRIVGEYVVEVASEQEAAEIETALKIPFDSAKGHLEKALALLSDRESPDYENSIKESISAVESVAKEITGKEKSLNALTQGLKLHPKFKTALDELYNWTSQAVRHGKSGNSPPVDQSTARFMLITCSAFVNYIIAKNPE